MADLVVLAGGTGDLGGRIATALAARGARVRSLTRPGTDARRTAPLAKAGEVVAVDFADAAALTDACRGAVCVVSALSGLEDTIVAAQARLLDAAVAAGAPRFIPSDFSVDWRPVPPDQNRNFALRRRFRERLDAAPIRATSVFNGAFMDMLVDQMPLLARPLRRVLYVENPDQRFAATTKDDTAAVTAAAALDPQAPRDLHVAGSSVSARDLATIMTEITGAPWRLLRVTSAAGLLRIIAAVRRLFPQSGQVFPVWQGLQYLHNMFAIPAPSVGTDNGRYPEIRFTTVRELLAQRYGGG